MDKKLLSEEFSISKDKSILYMTIDYEHGLIYNKLVQSNVLILQYAFAFDHLKAFLDNKELLEESFEFLKYKILEEEEIL